MTDITLTHLLWALTLGCVSAASLPLGSLVGLRVRFSHRSIATFAAFGAGALIAALSVELVAPASLALTTAAHGPQAGHARANFVALIFGGVCGGALFVLLDGLVNQQGGYIRKRATTLARIAKRRSEEVHRQLQAVLDIRPFNALPAELARSLAAILRPKTFRENQIVASPEAHSGEAYIVLEGELDIEIDGKRGEVAGPGTLVGLLALFVPRIGNLATLKANSDTKCLALTHEDIDHLRALSRDFDRACRELAGERIERLEQHLVTRLSEAVDWTHSAAEALRLGSEVPALVIYRAQAEHRGSPLAVWLGILLDGIPESLVIGAGLFMMLVSHAAVESLRFVDVIPYTLVAGLFLSNFPEALSSSANMLAAGWSRRRIFLMWFALMVTTALGAGLGFLLAGVLSERWLVFAEGVAAGAMLTMIAAAMIPEAAAHGVPSIIGVTTLAGFLAAVMFKLLE
jgi:zinc transporter ZupT